MIRPGGPVVPWPARADGAQVGVVGWLEPVLDDLAGDGRPLHWRRAWPGAEPGCLVVEVTDPAGRVLAVLSTPSGARVVEDDPRLPALRDVRAGGARVVAHRAGKRAVLALPGDPVPAFVKVASPRATARAVDRLHAVTALLAGTPGAPRLPVLQHTGDPARGVLVVEPMPGRPLAELVRAGDPAAACEAAARVGEVLAALAAVPNPGRGGLPRHTPGDEADVLSRSVEDAVAYGAVRGDLSRRLHAEADSAAAALRALPPVGGVLAHRDLHDGQVLLDGRSVGVLDWDTAAVADPAQDLANLLAHLDLAHLEGAAGAAAAVTGLARTAPPVDTWRVQVMRWATRLRLAAVHAFRPAAPGLVPAIVTGATLPAWRPGTI